MKRLILALAFICCINSALGLVPAQLDGHVTDGGSPVIGATVDAVIDTNENGVVDSGESIYATFVSMDLSDDAHDGYFRIAIMPEDFTIGETDVIITASLNDKTGSLVLKDITEGTSFDNDIAIAKPIVVKSSGGGRGSRRSTTTTTLNLTEEIVEPETEPVEEKEEEPKEEDQKEETPAMTEPSPPEDEIEVALSPEEETQTEPEKSGLARITGAIIGGGTGSVLAILLALAVLGIILFGWKKKPKGKA
jgi:hypothetical protein